jgi:hypothetical protein
VHRHDAGQPPAPRRAARGRWSEAAEEALALLARDEACDRQPADRGRQPVRELDRARLEAAVRTALAVRPVPPPPGSDPQHRRAWLAGQGAALAAVRTAVDLGLQAGRDADGRPSRKALRTAVRAALAVWPAAPSDGGNDADVAVHLAGQRVALATVASAVGDALRPDRRSRPDRGSGPPRQGPPARRPGP